jgi:hypothetical protein
MDTQEKLQFSCTRHYEKCQIEHEEYFEKEFTFSKNVKSVDLDDLESYLTELYEKDDFDFHLFTKGMTNISGESKRYGFNITRRIKSFATKEKVGKDNSPFPESKMFGFFQASWTKERGFKTSNDLFSPEGNYNSIHADQLKKLGVTHLLIR